MTSGASPFLAAATYWGRSSGADWWDDPRRDEVRRDFDAAAEHGLGSVGLTLPWPWLQPHGDNVPAHSMRQLEIVLAEAERVALKALITALPAVIGHQPRLPSWVLLVEEDPISGTLRRVPRHLMRDRIARMRAVRLVREVVGEFDSHPSVTGWVVGDRIEDIHPPRDPEEMEEWLRFIADAAALPLETSRFFHGISARALLTVKAVDPAAISSGGFGVCVSADWTPPWAQGAPEWLPFLAAYAADLARSAPIVAEVVPGDLSSLSVIELERMVEGLRDAGAQGLLAASLLELSPHAVRSLTGSAPERPVSGLLDRANRLTAAGRLWVDLARHSRLSDPSLSVLVDRELRAAEPVLAAARAFREFTS